MAESPIYLDHHSTTPVDPRVLEAMTPFFTQAFGNASSTSHAFGWNAAEAVGRARNQTASALGAKPREIIFTSGATESNNLAIRGVCEHPRQTGRRIISVQSEHKAVLDPLKRLEKQGFEIVLLPIEPAGGERAGWLDPQRVADALTDETAMVSVMFANNEIGVIHPIAEIAALCQQRGVLFHCDATQAVGRTPINVRDLGIDLLSFSAHKMYGPKGVGGLFIRRGAPRIRIDAQLTGGGQEHGYRAGTLNTPGIVGLGAAIEIAEAERETENVRLAALRDRLFDHLQSRIERVELNGPALGPLRLANNLNCSFADVEGEALMMSTGELAVSSGSACTSSNPEPSHVLRALQMDDDRIRSSLRFGLGRFTTEQEIDRAADLLVEAVNRLRSLRS